MGHIVIVEENEVNWFRICKSQTEIEKRDKTNRNQAVEYSCTPLVLALFRFVFTRAEISVWVKETSALISPLRPQQTANLKILGLQFHRRAAATEDYGQRFRLAVRLNTNFVKIDVGRVSRDKVWARAYTLRKQFNASYIPYFSYIETVRCVCVTRKCNRIGWCAETKTKFIEKQCGIQKDVG